MEENITVLDVGCGLNPRGDVNLDLYYDSIHRRNGVGPALNPHNIQNFIHGDGRNMPMFVDRQFHTVKCYHVIEHIPDWWNLLKELWRVTDNHLIVVCPHRAWINFPRQLRRSSSHISNFDRTVFEKAIPRLLNTWNFEVTTEYRGIFHKLIPFPLWPHMIRVDVWRG